jgi:hypothetical protein
VVTLERWLILGGVKREFIASNASFPTTHLHIPEMDRDPKIFEAVGLIRLGVIYFRVKMFYGVDIVPQTRVTEPLRLEASRRIESIPG